VREARFSALVPRPASAVPVDDLDTVELAAQGEHTFARHLGQFGVGGSVGGLESSCVASVHIVMRTAASIPMIQIAIPSRSAVPPDRNHRLRVFGGFTT
jgi:hypothetical protein